MILLKKAIRTMLRNKKAYISCILLMAVGIAYYISFSCTILNLKSARDSFYDEYRLADVFVKILSITDRQVDSLYEIDGIDEVVPRIVEDFRIECIQSELDSKNNDLMTVRLTSSDLSYEGNTINQYLYDGNDIQDDHDILLNIEFMNLNGLEIGDTVEIIHNGKEDTFTIVGSVMSPEYVYLMKDEQEFIPDKKTFGFGYISLDMMNALTNSNHTYNDLVITLDKGAQFKDVEYELMDKLEANGLISLIEKSDQLSYSMLDIELESVEKMATSIPLVFLLMVIAILYLTLKRVIEQERMEIGMMKAFGYMDSQILIHYLVYGLIVGLIGGLIGCVFGYFLADSLLTLYLEYFLLPIDETIIQFSPFIIGFILAIFVGLIGTYFGVKKVLRLSPVDSMKATVPIVNINKPINNNKVLKKIFKTSGFMSLRNIQRNKLRSTFIVLGIAFSFAMGAYMASATSMVDGMIFIQLDKVKRYDVKVNFDKPINQGTLQYFQDYQDVNYAQGIYETPITLRNGTKTISSVLVGLQENSQLYKIYNEKEEKNLDLNGEGIILCSYYADAIEAEVGDYIYIDSYLLDDSLKLRVDGIAQMTMADATYMKLDLLYKYFNVNGYTSVLLDTDNYNVIKENFKTSPNIRSIEDKETTNKNLKEMMSSYDIMFKFMDFMTIAIVFIIVYNISVIAFAERSREYATLKVIGFTTDEIADIVNLEFWILTIMGIVIGIMLTFLLKYGINSLMDIGNFTFDTSVKYDEILKASFECITAVYLSNFMNKKNIKKLELVTVLKERG